MELLGWNLKNIGIFISAHLNLSKKELLTNTVNFGFAIGSSFPEELGSGFSKDLDPVSGPLNKVR